MRRLKVMQVTHDLGIGGLPRVVATLAGALDRSRFEPSVLCLNETGPLAAELEQRGIAVLQLPKPSGARPDYFAFHRVARVLRERGIDVLHTHNTQPFIDGGIAGILARVPRHIHTDHARDFPDKRRYMLAERVLSRFADRVVGVSRHTSSDLVRYEGIDPARVVTIHNGIDSVPYEREVDAVAKRRSLGLSPSTPVLGLGVRLTEQKGIEHLLRAMVTVRRRIPEVVLLIAGYGPLAGDLEALAGRLGVAGCTRFLGPRLDMEELLHVFDVYVLPSLWEGFPLVLLEAMAAGCPIVATDVGGVSEAVRPGHNGLLAQPANPEALAAAILRLLEDEDLRLRFAAGGKRLLREEFRADVMARRYEELYAGGPG
ncbi:MAG: glycosyltransferase [Gemmatimonadota bacterium]